MSFLSLVGDAVRTDAVNLLSSLQNDDAGKLAIDAATILVDGVETLIDPTDKAQLSAAEAKFLNDLSLAGTDIGTIIATDVQSLLALTVSALVAGASSAAVAAAV